MPVAPTTATRGARGGIDDIVIYGLVACSMELENVPEVAGFNAQVLKGGKKRIQVISCRIHWQKSTGIETEWTCAVRVSLLYLSVQISIDKGKPYPRVLLRRVPHFPQTFSLPLDIQRVNGYLKTSFRVSMCFQVFSIYSSFYLNGKP